MKFIAYRFDCCPIYLEDNELTATCEQIDGKANFERRKEIISGFFDEGDRNYSLSDGTRPPFKKGNDLKLRHYKAHRQLAGEWMAENAKRQLKAFMDECHEGEGDNPVTVNLPQAPTSISESELPKMAKCGSNKVYDARIVYHADGVTIMRVQKPQKLVGEDKQYKRKEYDDNYASSLVVLVVRDGYQYVFMEASKRVFTPSTLSTIIESTLNRLLMVKYHVMVQVRPVRKLSDFWKYIDDKRANGVGIKRLRFRFDYPNMPWPDDLLAGRFKKMGIDLEAKATVILEALPGQTLNLGSGEGDRNKEVNSMGAYSCDKGNLLTVTDTQNATSVFGYKQSGDVKVELPDEAAHPQPSDDIFEQDSLANRIILKTKEVKTMNQGVGATN